MLFAAYMTLCFWNWSVYDTTWKLSSNLYTVSELCYSSNSEVLLYFDRLSTLINDFMNKEGSSAFREVSNSINGSFDVIRPHVLRSVYPESNYPNINTVLETICWFDNKIPKTLLPADIQKSSPVHSSLRQPDHSVRQGSNFSPRLDLHNCWCSI